MATELSSRRFELHRQQTTSADALCSLSSSVTRSQLQGWRKYATWEASQGEFDRARSVFERALDVEPTDVQLWLHYCETVRRSVCHRLCSSRVLSD